MRSRLAGRATVAAYGAVVRGRNKLFSLAVAGAFAEFGAASVLELPLRFSGAERIAVGRGVFVGAGGWLQAIGDGDRVALRLGDGTSISGGCVLSAADSIELGDHVLLARNVYIADHSHRFDLPGVPILAQGIDRVAPVRIGSGAWLGENVVVGPGVTIGAGAVVGANSVVLADVPARTVAVGAPARIVRAVDAVRQPA